MDSMKTKNYFVTLAFVLCAYASEAAAVDYKNIGSAPAIMFDAPSTRGQKLFIAPRGMPVEVVINYGAWSKVRDLSGDLSWVENKQLIEGKNVLVRKPHVRIRADADDSSDIVFSADKGVLLELIDATTPGWIKVKHRDGATGYVRQSDVWGI